MLISDIGGLVCAALVFLSVGYANFVVIFHIALPCFSLPTALTFCISEYSTIKILFDIFVPQNI